MLTTRISRILLVRTDRLGDVVLTLPMLPALRNCFPGARISMLLRHYTGEILQGNPYVDDILWYDDGRELVPFSDMVRTLKKQRFDAVVVVYPTPRLAWLMFRARIPIRVGTGYRSYSLLFNKRVYEHRKDARRHEVEYNLQLLTRLGCTPPKKPEFHLHIPTSARERTAEVLQEHGIPHDARLVVLHPGSGGSAREWGDANFSILARELAAPGDVRVLITGGPSEAARAAAVAGRSGAGAVSVAGRLSVPELAALLERASVFVANSTGPVHIAAALNVPVVGFYPRQRPMSAARWGPYTGRKTVFTPDRPEDCRDCEATGGVPCPCMESIPPADVLRAIRSHLRETEDKAGRVRR